MKTKNLDVIRYIDSLDWSGYATDHEKAIVSSNLWTFYFWLRDHELSDAPVTEDTFTYTYPTGTENILTCEQAAKYLDVSPATLAAWRSSGAQQIPFIKIGRKVKYKIEDLDTFIASRTFKSTGITK